MAANEYFLSDAEMQALIDDGEWNDIDPPQQAVPIPLDYFLTDAEMQALIEDGEWIDINPPQEADVIPQQGGGNQQIAESVHIELAGYRKSVTFNLHFKTFKVTVDSMEHVQFAEIPGVICEILEYILNTVLEDVGDREQVRICVESRYLNRPIWTPPTNRSQLTVARWMADIQRVLNSHEELIIDDTFVISVQHTEIPQGRCIKDVPPLLLRRLRKMRSVVVIKNTDNLCMARALVMGKALADGDTRKYRRMQKGKQITKAAKELIAKANVPERAYNLEDVKKFENVLTEYQIIVVSVDHANAIVHKGEKHSKRIMMLHHDGHYDLMKSLPAFFKCHMWCFDCMKGYNNRAQHRCTAKCPNCLRSECLMDNSQPVFCPECNRTFHGQSCFDHHKLGPGPGVLRNRRPLCSSVKRCIECHCIYSLLNRKPDNTHTCGETFCKACRTFNIPSAHRCYMIPKPFAPSEKERHQRAKFLYFDFETYVSESGQLTPNLAVVQNDDGDEWIFPDAEEPIGRDVTNDLCEFLFQEQHKGHYVIAHNFKGFDGYFILNWLLRNGVVPDIIMNGGKIMKLDVPAPLSIHFRDSYNYNPQSLAQWPATFGLENTCKGNFPHRFNRPDNWDAVLPFPVKEEYGYNAMKTGSKAEFDTWYDEEKRSKNNVFDFRVEFVQYCRNDVTVLRRCCQQFSQLFVEVSDGLNPFVTASTIAGVCSAYWRTFLLKPNQIALIPYSGYGRNRFQSVKAYRWLRSKEEDDQCMITNKFAGNEFKVGPYYVDGYCAASKMVNEFYGCFFHGCSKCYDKDTLHPLRNLKMSVIYLETLGREEYLRNRGYQVTTIWEHEYDDKVAVDMMFRAFVNNLRLPVQINPRDAFYGGRTNATKLYYKISASEKIRYYDVCSEYPFVNKNKRYPTGHPQIITRDFKNPREYFGLICCEVLPPDDLFLPVLPYRSNGKLVFPLCRTCADAKMNERCQHMPEERSITGTWCTPEVVAALDRGYSVLQVFEVWHFEDYQDRLFQEYIDRFLKLKVEASGWPSDVLTDIEKEQYISQYKENEGIILDEGKISLNPGMRSLAKLCLNSFWGRLGMQPNKLTTEYVSDPARFYDILLSGQYHVHSWDMFGEEVVQTTYTKEEEFVEDNPGTNVVLAAFTTCWARLHLYQFMEQVQDRLLYFDTDSIVFVDRPGTAKPPTGRFLGDLTSELKEGQFIVEFVSLGPKTYAYLTNDGCCTIKVKGFTLNGRTMGLISFNSMLSMLHNHDEVVVSYPGMIQRHKPSLVLKQFDMQKRFRMTYDKRRIVENWNTLPYGYVPR